MGPDQNVSRLESRIADLELRILGIKEELARLDDVQANLALDAADRRAGNALQGRGLGGALFGAKYRAAVRRSAAADNAQLSREVAQRKREIVIAKQGLKAQERAIRLEVAKLKHDLRSAKSLARQAKPAVRQTQSTSNPQNDRARMSKEELRLQLQELKALHQRGELTTMQYEQERIMLLTPST
jgi:hypothetical protein